MSSGLNNLINLINDAQAKERNRPYLIGISGGSGGGKTSVANLIHKSLGTYDSLLFSMDTYYKDLTPEQERNLSNYNFDSPEALDLDLLYTHLNDLMHWKKIQMPTYDFSTNKRKQYTEQIKPAKVIIFEGILAFYDKRMRDLMDLKLFIDLDDDIRLSRRIYRDIISRGREMETVLERYHKFVKTAYNNFIKPTKEYADIIIPRGGSNTIAIDLINYHLKYLVQNVTFKNDKDEIIENKYIKKIVINESTIRREEFYHPDTIAGLGKEDIFCEEQSQCLVQKEEENMFLEMFKNYLRNEQSQYFDLYIDIYLEKIKAEYKQDDLILFSRDDQSKIELKVKDRIKKLKNEEKTFNIFYFIPLLFEKLDSKEEKIIGFLKEIKEIDTIKIVSIFADKYRCNIFVNDFNIIMKAIYSGDKITNYRIFIENGGYLIKMDDENSNNLVSLSVDNFEERFLRLIESDKKKDNLSIINNYKEEE
jgi:uridine kinase